jgi:hypothetical protein
MAIMAPVPIPPPGRAAGEGPIIAPANWGTVIARPHLTHEPDWPAYRSSTEVAWPQWGQENGMGMNGS